MAFDGLNRILAYMVRLVAVEAETPPCEDELW